MTPQDVIDEITKSGLRGRGGAGFPAGKKWSQVARQPEKVRYVVCNGDEGDPGAFMDGSVMEGDPYKMIEGMVIAAYAVGAEDGYIYVRAEYPLSVQRLRMAIEQADPMAFLVIISLVPVLISTYISIAVPERSYVVKVLPDCLYRRQQRYASSKTSENCRAGSVG